MTQTTTDVLDALFSACNVEPAQGKSYYFPHSDTPLVGLGPLLIVPPVSVRNFQSRLRAFLNELDNTLTVKEILDELDDLQNGDQSGNQ